jgi:hypothetical protein
MGGSSPGRRRSRASRIVTAAPRAPKEVTELDPDRFAAQDDHALRGLGQGRRLAVRPVAGRLEPGDGCDDRFAAGGDDDPPGLEDLTPHPHAPPPDDLRLPLVDGDAHVPVAPDLRGVVEVAIIQSR